MKVAEGHRREDEGPHSTRNSSLQEETHFHKFPAAVPAMADAAANYTRTTSSDSDEPAQV